MGVNKTEKLGDLKDRIYNNAEKALADVYRNYKQEFIKFAGKYSKDNDAIIDAFQNAVIALYQNLIENKVSNLDNQVNTYLFTIGRNQLLSGIQKDRKALMVKEDYKVISDENVSIDKYDYALNKLGKTCKKLIALYYYRNYSIEAIMHELGMKSENSVKANKSRCIKTLRKYIEQGI